MHLLVVRAVVASASADSVVIFVLFGFAPAVAFAAAVTDAWRCSSVNLALAIDQC